MAYNSKYTGADIEQMLENAGGKDIYVTDFTLTEQGGTYDLASLADAIENGKVILVPWGGDWTGYSVVDNAIMDEEYITIFCHLNFEKNPINGDSGEVYFNFDRASGTLDERLYYSGQCKLVSGSNIKTINGQSLLGNGNITIEGGGSNTYTLDFTISDVEELYEGRLQDVGCNTSALQTAIEEGKSIVFDTGESVIRAYVDDYIYVTYCDYGYKRMYNLEIEIGSDAVYYYNVDAINFQSKLVSGTNIKTINGESILGSGNITIQGGSGGGSAAYPIVNHGTSDTTFTLSPNTFHVWDEVSSLTLTLESETAGIANEFLFQFTSGATATSLTLPDDIKWANDAPPTIAENMIYQVSILKGMASVLEFSNAPSITIINFTLRNYSCAAIEGMTWEQWVLSEYNTVNCTFMGNNIQRYGEIVGTSYTTYVTKTDVITSDFAYTLIPMT